MVRLCEQKYSLVIDLSWKHLRSNGIEEVHTTKAGCWVIAGVELNG